MSVWKICLSTLNALLSLGKKNVVKTEVQLIWLGSKKVVLEIYSGGVDYLQKRNIKASVSSMPPTSTPNKLKLYGKVLMIKTETASSWLGQRGQLFFSYKRSLKLTWLGG